MISASRFDGMLLTLVLAAPVASAQTPKNPFLADSAWPMSHGGPYNQDSTDVAGPTAADANLKAKLWAAEPVPITIAVSGAYANGERAIWANTKTEVLKWVLGPSGLNLVQRHRRVEPASVEISGAYTLVDKDGQYFVPRDMTVDVFFNVTPGRADSPVGWKAYDLRAQIAGVRAQERWVGLNLSYEGELVSVTNAGLVAVTSRDGQVLASARLSGEGLDVSNSLALDEQGGIYVLSSRYVHKLKKQGGRIAEVWRSAYPSDAFSAPGRLGKGSGTTPTLMGTGDEDKLLVISDGREKMHLLAFWRDEIPKGWRGLKGRDRRWAADLPITFGKRKFSRAVTEQSLVVSGNGIFAVDNGYGYIGKLAERIARKRFGADLGKATIYLSNTRGVAPYGVEKFTWDSSKKEMQSAWARSDISCPNGIPGMSRGSGLVYCVGQKNKVWNLSALDWGTGELRFRFPLSQRDDYNSFYAGLEIVAPGVAMSGTYGGAVAWVP